jgi:hypothetical protein
LNKKYVLKDAAVVSFVDYDRKRIEIKYEYIISKIGDKNA